MYIYVLGSQQCILRTYVVGHRNELPMVDRTNMIGLIYIRPWSLKYTDEN